MAFGFKIRKVETQGQYTLEELFEQIKDAQFTAGVPTLSAHGLSKVITFPPLDANNQVWLTQAQLGSGPFHKWQVYKNQEVGLTTAIVNEVASELTDGLTRLSGVIGKRAKRIEELVDATAEELNALGL